MKLLKILIHQRRHFIFLLCYRLPNSLMENLKSYLEESKALLESANMPQSK